MDACDFSSIFYGDYEIILVGGCKLSSLSMVLMKVFQEVVVICIPRGRHSYVREFTISGVRRIALSSKQSRMSVFAHQKAAQRNQSVQGYHCGPGPKQDFVTIITKYMNEKV